MGGGVAVGDGHVPVHRSRGLDAAVAGASGGDAAGMARHDEILREAIAAHGGHVVKATGDGVHAAFATRPTRSTRRSRRSSRRGGGVAVPEPLRVRMGIHSGTAELRDGDYFGTGGEPGGAADVGRARRPDRGVVGDRGAGPGRRGRARRPGRAPASGRRGPSVSSRSRTRDWCASSPRCRRWTRSRGTCPCR